MSTAQFQPPTYRGYDVRQWSRELAQQLEERHTLEKRSARIRRQIAYDESTADAKIGEALREARLAVGLSARQVAQMAGIDMPSYVDAEDGIVGQTVNVAVIAGLLQDRAIASVERARVVHDAIHRA